MAPRVWIEPRESRETAFQGSRPTEGTPEGFNLERGVISHSRAGIRSAQGKGYKCPGSGKEEAGVMEGGRQYEYLGFLSVGGLPLSCMPAQTYTATPLCKEPKKEGPSIGQDY
jgi:hypothetical protein